MRKYLLLCLIVSACTTRNLNYYETPEAGAPSAGVGGITQPSAGQGGTPPLPVAGSGGSPVLDAGTPQGGSPAPIEDAGTPTVDSGIPQGGQGGSPQNPTQCARGFEFRNNRCEDINECLSNPCGALNCVNHPGTYSCEDVTPEMKPLEASLVISNSLGWLSFGPNETAQGTLIYTNPNTFDVTIENAVIAGRKPGANHSAGPFSDLVPILNRVVLGAGESVTLDAVYTFNFSSTVGQWEFYPTWLDTAGTWHDGVSQYKEVRPTADSEWGTFEPSNPTYDPNVTSEVTWACYKSVVDNSNPQIYPTCTNYNWLSGKDVSMPAPGTCDTDATPLYMHMCPHNQMLVGVAGIRGGSVIPQADIFYYAPTQEQARVINDNFSIPSQVGFEPNPDYKGR